MHGIIRAWKPYLYSFQRLSGCVPLSALVPTYAFFPLLLVYFFTVSTFFFITCSTLLNTPRSNLADHRLLVIARCLFGDAEAYWPIHQPKVYTWDPEVAQHIFLASIPTIAIYMKTEGSTFYHSHSIHIMTCFVRSNSSILAAKEACWFFTLLYNLPLVQYISKMIWSFLNSAFSGVPKYFGLPAQPFHPEVMPHHTTSWLFQKIAASTRNDQKKQ